MNGFLNQYVVVALTRQLNEDQRTNDAARHRPYGRRRRDRNRIVPR
jgi:hypothetical protein